MQRDGQSDSSLKRRNMRAILIAACVCAAIIVAGIGVHLQTISQLADTALAQQTASKLSVPTNTNTTEKNQKTTTKRVAVPALLSFLGADQPTVLAALGPGAAVTSTRAVKEVDNPIVSVVTVALTNEEAGVAAGTPTVTLSLDAEGRVVKAGFTANLQLLGYGAISFVDAVDNLHVVETLLGEAGLTVPSGTVQMPASKAEYAVYGTDGITLEQERYTFDGYQDQADNTYEWDSTLTYDYAQANASGNLAYTVRLITIAIAAEQ